LVEHNNCTAGAFGDRADAMVWALSELMLGKQQAPPQIRMI
jgi:phage terminase large subunit-like protein